MAAERWQRVKDVFQAALDRHGDERAAYLEEACAGDADSRREVESLLAHHEEAVSFLETPHPALDLSQPSPFRVGTRLGPYEITGLLGSGGMGEVYRARDDRLGRDVAVKVLPSVFASSPERAKRFEQEARAASALSHPHILAVYDVGQHEGLPYLVTELLEGETLAKRMAKGPVPLRKALEWAAQAARGLTAVHEHGILHRDLKPSNLFVTGDGQLKILDFGIAKLALPPGVRTDTETRSGVLMGTVGYVSPEQVRGGRLDARSDQFSLACVLYEMLTGNSPFKRATAAQSLAAVLEDEPPSILARNPRLPLPIAWTVERCLAKDPQDRYAATRDLARDLELTLGRLSDLSGTAAKARRRAFGPLSFRPWVVAAVAIIAVFAVRRPASTPTSTPKRFVVTLSAVDNLADYVGRSIAILPDGSGLAYVGGQGNIWRLYLHTLSDGASRPLAGSDGALGPFFSPDGKWLGFFQDNKLKRVPLAGGPPQVICEAPRRGGGQAGASWAIDDRIVFSGGADHLWHVPASGGKPRALTTLDAAHGEAAHVAPNVLPDGRGVLFTVLSASGGIDDATIEAVTVDSGERRILVRGGASPRYSPTGHLLYVRGTDLLAISFDAARHIVKGAVSVVGPDFWSGPQYLNAQFDLSNEGTLDYVSGGGAKLERTLAFVDARGNVRPLPLPPRAYFHPSLLPGDEGVVVEIEDSPHNIWHGDLRSGVLTQLTRDSANHRPVLNPDGRFMAFSSDRTLPRGLFRQPTDGSGTVEPLVEAPHPHNATSWSPDGHWLAFTETHPDSGADIWVLHLKGDRRPRPFIKTPHNEDSAAFSPDGHWIAYASDESGVNQVLVTEFPGPGPRKQVSTNGGITPVFSPDGRRLFYERGNQVMVTDIMTTPTLTSGMPRTAFEIPSRALVSTGLPNFAVASTGTSILAVKPAERTSGPPQIQVVVNWFEELRSRVRAGP